MKDYKSLCILGRQPALGLAELESLYGSDHVASIGGAALLDIPAEEINFKRLGGTIKVARLLSVLPNDSWPSALDYLKDKIPQHLQHLPEGKFTLGVSLYGASLDAKKLNADLLSLKKVIRATGRSVRIVPNKGLELNAAQVLHNGLARRGAWELLLVRHDGKFYLAQTLFVQDIDAYGARDQARPARDARVGMLPPKLAQILINLAAGSLEQKAPEDRTKIRILDPFCGTGVVLQEALLMGYSVIGTDLEPRLVEYSQANIKWLVQKYPNTQGQVVIEQADAVDAQWPRFSAVASEVYLGRPLTALPAPDKLKEIIGDTNTIIKKFLANLAPQLRRGQALSLALPAWRRPSGELIKLPLIDHLTDMGYNYLDLKHVRRDELVYFREGQTVARQLIRISKQ